MATREVAPIAVFFHPVAVRLDTGRMTRDDTPRARPASGFHS
jgi:hypothetical protein